MDVMYCGDSGILRGVMYSMVSLLKNAGEELRFHIVTAHFRVGERRFYALAQSDARWLEHIARSYQPASSVTLYDVSAYFDAQPPLANMETRFTPGCMLRLYVDLIAGFPSKVLYLDYDVLCRSDLAELASLDMGTAQIAGVLDNYGQWLFMGGPFARKYLNSGVLMLDMDKIRETGLFARCREMCASKRMFMPDQSALNKLACKPLRLPRKFNEQRRLQPDTVLQHFCTSWRFTPVPHVTCVKPWERDRMHEELGLYEYDEVLDECAKWEGGLCQTREQGKGGQR